MSRVKAPSVHAHHYKLCACDDPDCGPHIVAFDKDDRPICQIVLSIDEATDFVRELGALLDDKAAEKDA